MTLLISSRPIKIADSCCMCSNSLWSLRCPTLQFTFKHFVQNCSRILLKEKDRKDFVETLKRPAIGYLQKKMLKKKILEKCKKNSKCPYCDSFNGNIFDSCVTMLGRKNDYTYMYLNFQQL